MKVWLMVSVITVAACAPAVGGASQGTTHYRIGETAYGGVNVFTDPETGCQYLVFKGPYALSAVPRSIDENGKQICETKG